MIEIIELSRDLAKSTGIDEYYFEDKDFKLMETNPIFGYITFMTIYVKNFNRSVGDFSVDYILSNLRNEIVHYYDRYNVDKIKTNLVDILIWILNY